MAAAELIIRIGGRLDSSLKGGVDQATRELDRLKDGAASAGDRMLSMLPPTFKNEIKGIGTAIGGLAGSFGGLGGVLAALGVGQLFDEFLTTTGALVDLSSQTDISIRDLQRFQFAGEQVGIQLNTITTAVGQLQNRLGSGDRSAFKALDDLKITFKDIQGLDPGQQFERIASAIAEVQDPSKRAAIAMDLFGRAGVQLLPLLRSNLKEVGDQASVLSDRTVIAADKFDDLFGRIKNFAKGVIAEGAFAPIVRWAEDGQDAIEDLGRSIDAIRGKMDTLPKLPTSPLQSNGPAPTPAFDFAEAMRESDRLTAAVERQQRAHEENARAAAAAARVAAEAQRQVRIEAEALVDRGIKRQIEAERELWASSVQSGLIASARESRSEVMLTLPVLGTWASQNQATTQTLESMAVAGLHLKDVGPQIFEGMRDAAARNAQQIATWRDHLTELSQSLVQLAQVSEGVFGVFTQSVARAIASVQVVDKSIATFKGGLRDLGNKDILSGLAGIVGGIGGISSAVSTAISLGKALFNVFDRNKGRDLVVEFAGTFGGFDSLHKRLADLGAEGERLWIALTQGVGRNNPGQAQTIIEEIERAFNGLEATVRSTVDQVIDDLEGRKITLPINFDVQTLNLPGLEVPELASGGIVTRPTLALVGEAGPEAVVPLNQVGTAGSGSDPATFRELQGMRSDFKRLPDVLFRVIRDAMQTA